MQGSNSMGAFMTSVQIERHSTIKPQKLIGEINSQDRNAGHHGEISEKEREKLTEDQVSSNLK